MPRIGIILGSTRPNRNGEQVAQWVLELASQRADAQFRTRRSARLPAAAPDEAMPASFGQYANEHTKGLGPEDRVVHGFVIGHARVQPRHLGRAQERDRLPLRRMEQQKPVGFVSYGGVGGARAAETCG